MQGLTAQEKTTVDNSPLYQAKITPFSSIPQIFPYYERGQAKEKDKCSSNQYICILKEKPLSAL